MKDPAGPLQFAQFKDAYPQPGQGPQEAFEKIWPTTALAAPTSVSYAQAWFLAGWHAARRV